VALGPIVNPPLTGPEVVVFGLNDIDISSGTPRVIPVPWPALIRITMSLADPEDDTIERTYQFVFSVPGEQN
jgi:hypothetical protein